MANQAAQEKGYGDISLAEGADMEGQYLSFWTDGQLFAVPIADVVQIVQLQNITQVPEFPSYAKGIINLRGSIIPVVDVRMRFGRAGTEYTDHTCIIVTNIRERLVGFIVDGVEEVTDIPDEEIAPPPVLSSKGGTGNFLTGIGKHENRVILLLNTQKILGMDELDLLGNGV